MIRIAEEPPISLQTAASMLAGNLGKPLSPETVRRWIKKGCHGVRLEGAYQGTRLVTSVAALQRFIEQRTTRFDTTNEHSIALDDEDARLLRERHGI